VFYKRLCIVAISRWAQTNTTPRHRRTHKGRNKLKSAMLRYEFLNRVVSNRKYREPRRGGDIAAEKRLCIYCRLSLLGVLQSFLYLVDMRKEGWPRRGALHLKKETQKRLLVSKNTGLIYLHNYINGLLRLYRFRLCSTEHRKKRINHKRRA